MNTVLLSTAYLAPVEYYVKLLTYDRILVEQYDHYAKQTYRNRCTIAAPDGPLALSVPTVKPDFFEYYKDDFRPFYERKYEFLMDFNEALCRLVCSLIDFTPHVERTTDYIASPADADDFRERIHPKKDFRTEDPDSSASTPRRISARKTLLSTPGPTTRYSKTAWASCPT